MNILTIIVSISGIVASVITALMWLEVKPMTFMETLKQVPATGWWFYWIMLLYCIIISISAIVVWFKEYPDYKKLKNNLLEEKKQMQTDYQIVRESFKNVDDKVYELASKDETVSKAFNDFRTKAIAFRKKYFPDESKQ